MKTSGKCPKCASSDVMRIPGTSAAFGAGNNIPLGPTIFSSIKVTRYLCGSCGYSEEWVDASSDLAKLREKYNGATT
jgi:ribosomal protein S27AE